MVPVIGRHQNLNQTPGRRLRRNWMTNQKNLKAKDRVVTRVEGLMMMKVWPTQVHPQCPMHGRRSHVWVGPETSNRMVQMM